MNYRQTLYTYVLWMVSITCMEAQTDTLQINEEVGGVGVVDYLSPLEYAFMMHQETPWMFKLSMPVPGTNNTRTFSTINDNRFNTGSVLGIAFERKIGTDWSVNASASYLGTSGTRSYFDFEVAPRWYYGMRKKVREGKSGNHLSGNYLSTGVVYQRNTNAANWLTFFGEWGVQRRFLSNGFLDFGFRVGYSSPLASGSQGSLSIGSNVNIGLAFAKDRQKMDASRLCDVFKCFDSQKRLLKLNGLNLFNAVFIDNVQSIRSSLEIGYEEKIGTSPFSIAAHISGSFNHSRDHDIFRQQVFGLTTRIGPRYYYNLRRQIAKGKSGNGLNGNYFALEFVTENSFYNNMFLNERSKGRDFRMAGDFLVGFQRTISDRLYYDFSIGIGVTESPTEPGKLEWRLPVNLGIGLRF